MNTKIPCFALIINKDYLKELKIEKDKTINKDLLFYFNCYGNSLIENGIVIKKYNLKTIKNLTINNYRLNLFRLFKNTVDCNYINNYLFYINKLENRYISLNLNELQDNFTIINNLYSSTVINKCEDSYNSLLNGHEECYKNFNSNNRDINIMKLIKLIKKICSLGYYNSFILFSKYYPYIIKYVSEEIFYILIKDYKNKYHLLCLNYMISNNYIFTFYNINHCVKFNNLVLLKLLLSNYKISDEEKRKLLYNSIICNSNDCTKYMIENNFVLSPYIKLEIFKKNRLDLIELLIKNNYNFNSTDLYNLMIYGKYDILVYIINNQDIVINYYQLFNYIMEINEEDISFEKYYVLTIIKSVFFILNKNIKNDTDLIILIYTIFIDNNTNENISKYFINKVLYLLDIYYNELDFNNRIIYKFLEYYNDNSNNCENYNNLNLFLLNNNKYKENVSLTLDKTILPNDTIYEITKYL